MEKMCVVLQSFVMAYGMFERELNDFMEADWLAKDFHS